MYFSTDKALIHRPTETHILLIGKMEQSWAITVWFEPVLQFDRFLKDLHDFRL
jgi:hypothetical protein